MRPFRFGTVGSPLSTPKKPGGSVGAVHQIAELGLSALELGGYKPYASHLKPVLKLPRRPKR